ncbi:MAG: YEATS family protein [Candidatus Bathyarchaeota archaeon BA1]|nr:MAG: YEATS family protein [Candidatus Bathyarchaeota archaeon BA1]
MKISFNNYAKRVARRGNYDWYEWRVFVDEDDTVLNKIEYVLYLLHPTFPNPIRIVHDKKSKFALESSGWGSFTMFITVRFKDGTEEEVRYFLDLSKKWPD